jgi:hypothetical protein
MTSHPATHGLFGRHGCLVRGHGRPRERSLMINPGSSGPRRFSLPVSAGELLVGARGVTPRLAELALNPSP